MKIVDVLKIIGTKRICTRCKKVIRGDKFKQIDEHYFCLECVSSEGKIFPEYLLLKTPFILKDEAQITKTLTCPICKKEAVNPFFHSPTENDSPYFFTWIGNQRLCYLCARKQITTLNESSSTLKRESYFFYPVSDCDEEKSYWDNAVTQANNERQKNYLSKPPEFFEMVARTIVYQYDTSNEDMIDDITSLYIYANSDRTLWCFKLEHDYNSGWDGWPVWMGGFITPEQFIEFMKRMKLRYHLFLFDKAEK